MKINQVIGYLSIRYKFIITFFIISFIPLIVVGTYGLFILSTGLNTMAKHHAEDEVFTIARLMDSFLTTVQHDLSNLSVNIQPLVEITPIRNTSYPNQDGKVEFLNQVGPYFHAFLTQHEGYRKISYFDEMGWEKVGAELKDGEVKFSSSESLQYLGETEFYEDSIEQNPGEIYICELRAKGGPRIWFGTPVTDENGSKKGVLVAEFSMAAFHDFAAKAHPPSNYLTFLVDNQGQYIYHPLKANGTLVDDYPPEVVSEIISGQNGIVEESTEEIIGYARVSDKLEDEHKWIVVLTIPRAAIFSQVKKLSILFSGVLGVMVLGVLTAGFFAARHFTKPIEELRKGTANIARGDLDYKLDIHTNDEIEQLANDFNYMSRALSDLQGRLKLYTLNLEEKVEERTKEIEKEKQKLDNIVVGIGTALILVDRELNILWRNDIFEKWFGEIDTYWEIKCHELFQQLDSPCNECPAVQTFRDGTIEQIEKVMTTRTGEKKVYQYTTGPISENDDIIQVLIMIQDITEKKQLEAQVMHREKMSAFGLLSAGIAHEIGNPLSSLSSLLQYAQRTNTYESVKETFSLMDSHIDRISNIVREMVDFARPPKYEWQPTNVNDVITSAIGIANYDPRSKDVEIETLLDPEIPLISIVPDQLLQVCLNIILNAFDAMGPGGQFRVTSKKVDGYIEIAFQDNGAGMSEEVMEHVFEPFFTTKEEGEGTGLGLSVSYGITKNFGGEILVGSQIGTGTTFTVVLPTEGNGHERKHTNS